MPDHAYYEELTALSAGGHLSEEENEELRQHLAGCAGCRADAQAYRDLVCAALPLTRDTAAVERETVTAAPDEGARARFLDRARREGVNWSNEVEAPRAGEPVSAPVPPSRRSSGYRVAAGLAFAATIAAAVISGVQLSRWLPSAASGQEELTRLRSENAQLNERLTARDQELAGQQAQLRQLQTQLGAASRTASDLRRDDQQRGVRLGQSTSQAAQLLAELQNREQQLAAAAEAIGRINQLRVTDRATLDAQRGRILQISNQLRIADATLDMERQLSDAGKDILDLMRAKQLRVVDVRDTDANGRPSAAFARVFVSEGRTIRIFAFDLNDAGSATRFQVWGEQTGNPQSVRSLGTLTVDDRAQNRWGLTIQNADVVKDISSVFVTTSRGNTPDGPRLLYAFLGQPGPS